MITIIPYLQPLAGFALFLFALRFLHQAIDDSVGQRLKPILKYCDRGFSRPLLCGFFVTLLVQASSITIIASMALASRRLLTINTAILIMFGATIGTAAKSLIFSFDMLAVGYFLLAASGIFLLLARKPLNRRTLEIIFSVGMMFLGWKMIKNGLDPITTNQEFVSFFKAFTNPSILHLLAFACLAFVITALVQSSSTMVIVLMGLSQTQELPISLCLAGILGANVGTTITALIASIEYRTAVKRIALAHFIMKAVGATGTILMLPMFINLVDLVTWGHLNQLPLDEQIAAGHIVFNVTNVAIWLALFPLLTKMVTRALPQNERGQKEWLPQPVILMLRQLPTEALQEVEHQWKGFKEKAKVIEDEVFVTLASGRNPETPYDIGEILGDLNAAEDLLLSALRRITGDRSTIVTRMTDVRNLRLMTQDLDDLRHYLSALPRHDLAQVSQQAATLVNQVEGMRQQIWLAIFHDHKLKKSRKMLAYTLRIMEEQLLNLSGNTSGLDDRQVLIYYQLSTKILAYLQRALSLAGQRKDRGDDIADLLDNYPLMGNHRRQPPPPRPHL